MPADLAARLAGSADLFDAAAAAAARSVNFVAAHDGFTLADLVTYARKHNEANGEDNRDGHGDNLSATTAWRARATIRPCAACARGSDRNLLATLLLAQGTPMLLMGDEVGRSQGGNNNAYCQDNPTSWTLGRASGQTRRRSGPSSPG